MAAHRSSVESIAAPLLDLRYFTAILYEAKTVELCVLTAAFRNSLISEQDWFFGSHTHRLRVETHRCVVILGIDADVIQA